MAGKSRGRKGGGQAHPYTRKEREVAPPRAPEPAQGGAAPPVSGARTIAASSPPPTVRTRDQRRAAFAYQKVAAVAVEGWAKEYKTQVHSLGANVLRSGLSAAVAFVQRSAQAKNDQQSAAAKRLLTHLATAELPGLDRLAQNVADDDVDGPAVGAAVRGLDLDTYMLASREALAVVTWLKRAAQVLIREAADDGAARDAQPEDGDA